MKLSLSQKNGAFLSFNPSPPLPPSFKANVLFSRLFFESHPVLDQTQGSNFRCCVSTTLWKTPLHVPIDKKMFV